MEQDGGREVPSIVRQKALHGAAKRVEPLIMRVLDLWGEELCRSGQSMKSVFLPTISARTRQIATRTWNAVESRAKAQSSQCFARRNFDGLKKDIPPREAA